MWQTDDLTDALGKAAEDSVDLFCAYALSLERLPYCAPSFREQGLRRRSLGAESRGRKRVVDSVEPFERAKQHPLGFRGSVVLFEVRLTESDMLRSGIDEGEHLGSLYGLDANA
jgi:hypothetical protein